MQDRRQRWEDLCVAHTLKTRRKTKDICDVWPSQKLVDSKVLLDPKPLHSLRTAIPAVVLSLTEIGGDPETDNRLRDWGCCSVIEYKTSMCEALGLISPKHKWKGNNFSDLPLLSSGLHSHDQSSELLTGCSAWGAKGHAMCSWRYQLEWGSWRPLLPPLTSLAVWTLTLLLHLIHITSLSCYTLNSNLAFYLLFTLLWNILEAHWYLLPQR